EARRPYPELAAENEPGFFTQFATKVGGLTHRQAEAMYWKDLVLEPCASDTSLSKKRPLRDRERKSLAGHGRFVAARPSIGVLSLRAVCKQAKPSRSNRSRLAAAARGTARIEGLRQAGFDSSTSLSRRTIRILLAANATAA